jgi:hypothetical protein
VIQMRVLAQVSAPLLVLGGGLMAALLLIMALAPTAPALYGFFVVAPAIGLGALGATLGAGASAGRLGRVSGWVAAVGGVAVVTLSLYAVATGQFAASAGLADDDPLAIPFMLTSMAWMLGSLGVALALVRGGAIPSRGAWLVLAGTATAIVLGTLLAMVAPALSALSALPFAVGWMVVGRDSRGSIQPSWAEGRSSSASWFDEVLVQRETAHGPDC